MGMIVWVLIGAALAGLSAPSRRFAFPAGRPACLLGGMAGGFLGGGTLTVATGTSQADLYAPAGVAAGAGALLVIAAVGWAGRTDYTPQEPKDARKRSAR